MSAATPERAQLLAQLTKVLDPCSITMGAPKDICQMGLVEDLDVDAGRVRVSLVLTDPSCVFFAGIRRHVTDVLLELPGVEAVDVEIANGILWTPDRAR